MSNPLFVSKSLALFRANTQQALITVDIDPDAERLVIIDRNTFDPFGNVVVNGGVFKTRVPASYLYKNELMVGILDNNRQFNAKFVDGVEPELINPTVTKIR